MAVLYVVGTPIGNLEDISLRALRVLKEVDVVLCEDTRVTRKLLDRYEIKTKTMSYHQQSSDTKIEGIKELLREGKNLALVTDAGTPGISDPGSYLVDQLHKSFTSDELSVVAVPGPSAVAAALSISGMPSSDFLFLGFLPHKKGRPTLFCAIAASERTVVFYESPHRILKALASLKEVLDKGREVAIGRELTKIHEEVRRGTASELLDFYTLNQEKQRGEFVVLVAPK